MRELWEEFKDLPFLIPLVVVKMAGDAWLESFTDSSGPAKAFAILALFAVAMPAICIAGGLMMPLLILTPFWWAALACCKGSE
jgi:hypothetical protein